jgi:hypothetical protein
MWKDCQDLPASNSVNAARFYHLAYSSCSMKLHLVQTLQTSTPAPPLPVCLSGVHSNKFNLFYSICSSFSYQNSLCRLLQTSVSILPHNTEVKHKYKTKYNLLYYFNEDEKQSTVLNYSNQFLWFVLLFTSITFILAWHCPIAYFSIRC